MSEKNKRIRDWYTKIMVNPPEGAKIILIWPYVSNTKPEDWTVGIFWMRETSQDTKSNSKNISTEKGKDLGITRNWIVLDDMEQ